MLFTKKQISLLQQKEGNDLSKFSETIRQYGATLKLIAADSVWRFKKESFFILLTGFLGTSFQLLTIGLALYYAHTLEKGGIIKLLGLEFQARTSMALLFLLGMGVLPLLLLSAGLIYFSKTKTIALMRKYEEFCAKRIFSLFGSSIKVWMPPEQSFNNDRTISRLVRIDSRNNSRVLGIILAIVVPTIILLVSICTLFYTNIFLTCLMLVFFGIASFFQYKINIVGVRNSTRMENYVRDYVVEYNQIIQRQKNLSNPLPENEAWFENELFSSDKIKRYMDAYVGRLKVLETSHFVSNILFAIAIFMLLLIMGTRIIFKADNWSNLVIYLIALRYVLVNLRQLNRQITNINRFYPQIKRYFLFLKNTETSRENRTLDPVSYMIQAANSTENSLKTWQLSKGSKLGLVSAVKLNRYSLEFMFNCLLGHSGRESRNALESVWFMALDYGNAYSSLRGFLRLPAGYSLQHLQKDLEESELWDKFEKQLPCDLEKPIPREKWDQADTDLKVALALFSAIHSQNYWVMLEENALRHLSDRTLQFFMNRLSNRILVIVFYQDTHTLGRYGEDVIAILSGDSIIGLGPVKWFEEHRHIISHISNQTLNSSQYKRDKEDEGEDLLDDEDI